MCVWYKKNELCIYWLKTDKINGTSKSFTGRHAFIFSTLSYNT